MPNFLKYYTNKKYALQIRNEQRKRNYSKTALYAPGKWTPEEDYLVLAHNMSDAELSLLIHHSVQAIQVRRYRLKRLLKEEVE